MGRASRQKGQRGEREVCKLLADKLGGEYKRNLMQTQDGGYDVLGLEGYAIEVKFQEKLQIEKWWEQTVDQANGKIPVLFFRRSREDWRVVLPLEPPHKSYYSVVPIDYFLGSICDGNHRKN
jgi:Holliday junction resolvase|tara:strand:- start:2453 stop:2818 length:366 start_codon:yes stop_codon:yes gene_type:complete